jgi:hypothetical protein
MSLGMEDFSCVKAQVLGAQIATFLLQVARGNYFNTTHFLWVDPGTNSPPPSTLSVYISSLLPCSRLKSGLVRETIFETLGQLHAPKYSHTQVTDCRYLSRWGQGIKTVVQEVAQR